MTKHLVDAAAAPPGDPNTTHSNVGAAPFPEGVEEVEGDSITF
jgi:hypothetical protein